MASHAKNLILNEISRLRRVSSKVMKVECWYIFSVVLLRFYAADNDAEAALQLRNTKNKNFDRSSVHVMTFSNRRKSLYPKLALYFKYNGPARAK